MNEQFFSASFQKGSNKIFGSTQSNFSSIRPNSFAKLNGIPGLFVIVDKSKDFYIHKFFNNNGNIEVKQDISEILNPGDDIKISFKEYSVGEFFIKSSGSGYAVGDLLDLSDENAIQDSFDKKTFGAIFKVEKVDDNGSIKSLSLENSGRHLFGSETKKECKLKGGYGSGIALEVSFVENSQTVIVERTVIDIVSKGIATDIILNSPVNKNLVSGKLSFEKWSLTTKHPNTSPSVTNNMLSITRDFTPFLKMPIIPGNTDTIESHYNKAISILDQKIEELDSIIKKLS